MRKHVALVLILGLCAAMVFAGGQKETTAATEKAAVKVWAVNAAEIPLDPDKIQVWQTVEEKAGVDLSWEFVSSLSEIKDEKFNLMMVSGDIADVVAYYEGKGGHTTINRYGSEGAFIPLEDLIAEHAPNLKRIVLDDPLIREAVTAQDGHVYFVPMLSALNAARGWFIRYDWLNELGLEAPKTTEELYNVLKAFRDGDPNGNGQKDEIPLVFRRRGDDWTYNIGALAYAFDADTGWVVRNGKVVYGPSEPQFKDYLAYIRTLYTEGLIDREVLTRKGNPRDELFGRNVAGAIHDWFASTSSLNDTLADDIPAFELRHFQPPVGTADEPYTRIQMSKVRTDGGWAVSASNEYPVETIKMMDYLFSPEGQILTNFGIENVHYTMQNGKPVYKEIITKNPDGLGMHEALVAAGAQWKIGMAQSVDYEAQFANAIATAARIDYMENYIIDEFPVLGFTEEENDVLKDKFAQIQSYVSEMSARVMVGEFEASEWDSMIAEMKKTGLDEVTAIYQEAYNRKMK